MKAKQISDTTVKITIGLNDLEERGMALSDFIMPQEKTEDFFYTMLEEVDLPETFRYSGMLSFRVTPKPDKVDIFVTKSDVATEFELDEFEGMAGLEHLSPEEFFKNLEQNFAAKSDSEAQRRLAEAEEADEQASGEPEESNLDYVHYVLTFDSLTAVMDFAELVDYPVEASELYKFQGAYRLTLLIYVENQPVAYPDRVYARILEHAQEAKETRAYLREHAILLREGDVLAELADVRG